MNKRLILSLLGISLFPVINNNLILESEASNISKNQEDLSPLITYTTEKIGDREKMKVTVTVEDRSGSGIKEFKDPFGNKINSNTYTTTYSRRNSGVFTVIDNNNNENSIKIDLNWINPYTSNHLGKKTNGSSYWTSSNLREWLNSDKDTVQYTGISPSYSNEKGFLNEFTEKEKDAIAITERRVLTEKGVDSLAVEGGSTSIGHMNTENKSFLSSLRYLAFGYKNLYHKKDLDKVFLLTPHESYWYLYRRGENTLLNVSDTAKLKNNTNATSAYWWMQGTVPYGEHDSGIVGINEYDLLPYRELRCGKSKMGVVPVINIKQDYVFDNGKIANSLKIGDTIMFGRYLNTDIEWKVINISDEGCPMLMSKYILDFKEFDAYGDYARLYSDYINYDDYDISLFDDVEYKTSTGIIDNEVPMVNILNKDELNKRQNNSFTIDLEVYDEESGLDYVIDPKGNKITDSNFSYTFYKNGDYIFKLKDRAGNFNDYLININNINEEPFVSITTSATDWSKRNVLIDIDTSYNTKYMKDVLKVNNIDKDKYFPEFPNYVSYIGKKVLISGKLNLISSNYNKDDENPFLFLGFGYKTKEPSEYGDKIGSQWPHAGQIYLNDIPDSNLIDFEFEYIIPKNFAYKLAPWLGVSGYQSINSSVSFSCEVLDLKYEILDTSNDFSISSIELPSGEIVSNSSYIDEIDIEGINTWTYKIIDSRGKETVKTVTTKIDKTAPTLNLNYNTNITNQNITVNINSSDATSGVKRIKLPNGNYITNSNSTYTISGDGEYTFECEDVAGNITTKTITINNIDKEKPSVVIDKNNIDWTNKPVKININSRD